MIYFAATAITASLINHEFRHAALFGNTIPAMLPILPEPKQINDYWIDLCKGGNKIRLFKSLWGKNENKISIPETELTALNQYKIAARTCLKPLYYYD